MSTKAVPTSELRDPNRKPDLLEKERRGDNVIFLSVLCLVRMDGLELWKIGPHIETSYMCMCHCCFCLMRSWEHGEITGNYTLSLYIYIYIYVYIYI